MDEDLSFLDPLDLITKDVYELRKIVREKKKFLQKDRELNKEHETECARAREKDRHEKDWE